MSEHLKKWRETLGLTLKDVSERIHRHFTTIQKWEQGINAVGMKELDLLSRAYGVPAFALTLDPVSKEFVGMMQKAYGIMQRKTHDDLVAWLDMGERLPDKPDFTPPSPGAPAPPGRSQKIPAKSRAIAPLRKPLRRIGKQD